MAFGSFTITLNAHLRSIRCFYLNYNLDRRINVENHFTTTVKVYLHYFLVIWHYSKTV